MKNGIYDIYYKKHYIGYSKNLASFLTDLKTALDKGTYRHKILQKDWDSNFKIKTIPGNSIVDAQLYMNTFKPEELYNTRPIDKKTSTLVFQKTKRPNSKAGGKFLTFKEVKLFVENRGFKLLSTKYEGVHTILHFVCKTHGKQKAPFTAFKYHTYGCPECAEEARTGFLYTTKEINKIIKKRGYRVDKNFNWTGAKNPVSFICDSHGLVSVRGFLSGRDCPKCGIEKRKVTIAKKGNYKNKLLDLLKQRGFSLISKHKYINSTTKVKIRCLKDDYEWKTSLYGLKNNKHGCSRCSGCEKIDIQQVNMDISKQNYSLQNYSILKDINVNNNTSLIIKCSNEHTYISSPNKWKSGYKCPFCAGVKVTTEDIISRYKSNGFKILDIDNYKTIDTKLKVECEKGHKAELSLKQITWGNKCSKCSGSLGQKSLFNLIKKWYSSDIEVNTKKIIHPYELDIYLKDKNIAFEYNGLYYHNEDFVPNDYHSMKTRMCKNLGIKLVQIWDYEYKDKKLAVQSRLKAILGFNKYRIGARKTELKIVRKNDAKTKNFLNKYHVQGAANFDTAFQLWYKNKLIAVMTFSKPHRQNIRGTILNRYCVKKDYTVSGGASKLFKAAKNEIKDTIVSYSDNRWSEGNIYRELNFVMDKELKPDYFYSLNGKPKSKQSLKKKKHEKNLTEHELRYKEGYRRVWDCGKIRWVYKRGGV